MKKRNKRIILIIFLGLILIFSTGILLNTLSKNIMFFMTPTELKTSADTQNKIVRVGGLVKKGSINRNKLIIEFTLTDCKYDINVEYSGILPDLFREGQGVIVNGKIENGTVKAITLFAKHDERYIPRELYKASIAQNICKNN